MKRFILSTMATLTLVAFSYGAQAGFVVGGVTIGSAQTLANNLFAGDLNLLGYDMVREGPDIAVDMAGTIEFFFHAKEADFENTFEANGGAISDSRTGNFAWSGAGTSIGSYAVAANQVLDWEFLTASASGLDAALGTAGFGVFYNGTGVPFSDTTIYLGYDDAGPDNPTNIDDNHDDYILSAVFKPQSVPEPGTLAMLAIALLGLGGLTRGRSVTNG